MRKKYFTIIGLVLLAVLLVSGCSSNEKASKLKSENKSGSTGVFLIEEIEKNVDLTEFEKKYPGYQLTFDKEPGFESVFIANHDFYDFQNLPNYQEVISYGYVSLESDDIVYSLDIFIKDTKSYYAAEYDAETKALLVEEGDWRPEGDLAKFTAERLEMMDYVLQQ